MKSSLSFWIGFIIIITVATSFAFDEQVKTIYGLEAKIGFGGERDITPYGAAGSFRMSALLKKAKIGAEFGVMVTSNWDDTLDISTSPTPGDSIYDFWAKNGTDVSFIFGPRISYELLGNENSAIRLDLGTGALMNISSFDETKEHASGSPSLFRSDIETGFEFYFRPRLEMQYNKVYVAYEYFLSDNIHHVVCFGLMFF
jgi:hypothetical protein